MKYQNIIGKSILALVVLLLVACVAKGQDSVNISPGATYEYECLSHYKRNKLRNEAPFFSRIVFWKNQFHQEDIDVNGKVYGVSIFNFNDEDVERLSHDCITINCVDWAGRKYVLTLNGDNIKISWSNETYVFFNRCGKE